MKIFRIDVEEVYGTDTVKIFSDGSETWKCIESGKRAVCNTTESQSKYHEAVRGSRHAAI